VDDHARDHVDAVFVIAFATVLMSMVMFVAVRVDDHGGRVGHAHVRQ
jgi:hypothetical protein